ncbi:MAG: 50S ribosomal protein L22 [Acidobacteria bacterium]|jgi:large subunit ribosomal protein L22|nr:50S ribosomal protein L22 [Acidobacteriota bacterium]
MEAKAIARYIKGSPQKARLVVDLIRGKKVGEALSILRYTRKRAGRPIEKVLRSAIANAEQKKPTLDVDDLFISRACVDLGPTKYRKRVRPAPMGRAYRQMRRMSHITIHVTDGAAEGSEKEEA